MKKITLLTITVIIINVSLTKGQVSGNKIAIYNVGLGSLVSGIGALINKKPTEKWHKVVLKGMGQGALGGFLVYQSKNVIKEISVKENFNYSWYSKFVNSAGISIIESASANRNFWEVWHLNIGFNRIEFRTKDKFQLKYKILPISFIYTVVGFARTNFELRRSTQTGEFIFSVDSANYSDGASVFANVAVFSRNNLNNYNLYSHETVHIYQYYDYNFVNTYLNKPLNTLRDKSTFFTKINNLIYFDFQGAVLRPLYLMENINQNCYFDNFFENEAEFFTNTPPQCR